MMLQPDVDQSCLTALQIDYMMPHVCFSLSLSDSKHMALNIKMKRCGGTFFK